MPVVNYDLMLQEMLTKTAGKVNQVIYWGRPLDWHNQTLTPNPDTLYFMAFFNTKDVGPIVIEVPPADADGSLNANIVNVWQVPLEDAGLLGVDKGKGVKLLMLPPGYSEKVPEGYAPLQPGTWGSYALFRSNLKSHGDADVAKSLAYGKRVKIYPLSQASNPPADRLHRRQGRRLRLDHPLRRQLLRRAQSNRAERAMARSRSGDDRSVEIARHREGQTLRAHRRDERGSRRRASEKLTCALAARYDAGLPPFFDGTHWTYPAPQQLIQAAQAGFTDPNSYPVDERGLAYHYAYIGIKRLGAGQFYMISIKDKDGESYDGGKTYRLTVPPNAPVEQYWSVTAYDRETHALIKNVDRASRASNSAEVKKNADGSVDLYFGPKAPAGKESNWVPTDPARKFELMVRFYAPTKALFDKTWKLPDVEKMK